jgi:tetratricopeptide (TPR) repeat protein
MGAVVMLPIVLVGFAAGYEIGVLFTMIAVAFLAGLAVSLLGRLCGFFAFGDEAAEPTQGMAPEGGGSVAEGGTRAPGAPMPPEASDEPQDPRPPLLDAETAVAAARKQAETDREGALAALEALCEAHPPHPLVLHALALLLRAASRPEALAVAGEAIRLALKRGIPALATELFGAFWKEARRLDLKPADIDAIGAAFQKSGDLGQAAAAFGLALNLDRTDRQAVKGLMKIADQRLYREGRPKDAARIYTFLLQYAADSPLAEDFKRELAEAEARLKRAV